MGFPENVLANNERVVKNLHPHWLIVFGPTVVGVILIAVAGFVAWVTPDDETGNRIQWIVVAVVLLLAIPLVVVPYLNWRTTRYVITTHRVMVRRGVFAKSGKDITFSKVTDVSFSQSILDRIIGAGTLQIESAGDSPDELMRNIPHSDQIQQLVNRLMDADANRRAGAILEAQRLAGQAPGAEWSPASAAPSTPPTPSSQPRPGSAGSSQPPAQPSQAGVSRQQPGSEGAVEQNRPTPDGQPPAEAPGAGQESR